MCSNNGEAVECLEEALEKVAATASASGAAGSGDRIGRLLAAKARLDAVVYAEVAGFDAAGACVDDGAATTVGWLRAQQRLGRRDASGLVFQCRRLRDLGLTSAALAEGAISREHATAIVRAQAASGLDADGFARYESILVDLARQASPDEVRAAAAHLVDAEAPDRDHRLLDALAGRRLDLVPVGDLVKVDAMIDKPTAEALTTAVEALSRRSPGDDRTWHQRRADAFGELVQLGLESGQIPQQGRTKPHLSLLVTLDQLTGIHGAGPLLARYGRIPTTTAQRLGCDGVLTRILTDACGHVVDVGRASRHTTTAQNTALTAMYTTCGYPNCDTPLARCDIHHVTWWSHGGPTNLDNLLPLCKTHHQFVHEHGYTITARRDPDGHPTHRPHRWRFLTPRGAPIPDHTTALTASLHQLSFALAPPPPRVPIADPPTNPHSVTMPTTVATAERVPLPDPGPPPDFGPTPAPFAGPAAVSSKPTPILTTTSTLGSGRSP
jgi:uncharacterized protein DUF222/HNH endonuclease